METSNTGSTHANPETMSSKPIFVATHPRACSTAFERVFMTRQDILTCIHEPFGDAFYFGPERMGTRYENDETARLDSGFASTTYKDVFESIERASQEGKRLFIKDIIHYLAPPDAQACSIAPSLGGRTIKKGVGTPGEINVSGEINGSGGINGSAEINGSGETLNGDPQAKTICGAPYPYATASEPGNPTIVPLEMLKQFHFTFLIRHPRHSIPSYWRCTIPPLEERTGFSEFMPSEAGYRELRRVFDFLVKQRVVGPALAGKHGQLSEGEVSITVVDADDLLDNPEAIISAYCKEVGIAYDLQMLNWDNEEDHQRAKDAFEKWKGFHDDALNSKCLKPRHPGHKKKAKSTEHEDQEWLLKYGEEAAKAIRECVNANVPDYEYLKSFAIEV